MKSNKVMEEHYYELSVLDKQAKELVKQLEEFEQQLVEVDISLDAIKTIYNTKKENEILVPVCPGVFAKARLTETDKFIVNIGSGAAVERSNKEVIKLMEKQKKAISDYNLQARQHLTKIYKRIEDIEKELKNV